MNYIQLEFAWQIDDAVGGREDESVADHGAAALVGDPVAVVVAQVGQPGVLVDLGVLAVDDAKEVVLRVAALPLGREQAAVGVGVEPGNVSFTVPRITKSFSFNPLIGLDD